MLPRMRLALPRHPFAFAGLVLAAGVSSAFAGAWTLPEGKGQVIVSGLYAEAAEAFGEKGSREAIPVFRKADLSAYVEYGLTDWLTAIGQAEAQSFAANRPPTFGNAQFALGMAGARVRLWHDDRAVVSAELAARFEPGEDGSLLSGLSGGGIDLRLLGGYGFALGDWPSFVNGEVAYRPHLEDGDGEVRLDLTLGTRPRERLLLLAQSFNALSAELSGDLAGGRAEHKLHVSAVYDLTETLSVQVGGLATVAGRHSLRERGLVTALWFRF